MGANDGIVSTASLILGVAATGAARHDVLIAGFAGLVAGAMSMAAGEYVSVSSQSDVERADLSRERVELAADPGAEKAELVAIYVARGLDADLAQQVADQLTAKDALATHARDELGIDGAQRARPVQAALASAMTFSVGAAIPILIVRFVPVRSMSFAIATTSLGCLALLGSVAARAGGARPVIGALRVAFWGALAMALTYGVGLLFGTVP
jgi:VIT1/CCC1 family predicted Fe2+/Mn2+ transporter